MRLRPGYFEIIRAKPYLIALVAIVVAGGALRLYNLSQPSYWNDESDTALQALGLLKYGIPKLPSGRVEYEAILSPVLVAFAWIVGGQSDFPARIVSVIFGVSTLVIVFLIGRLSWGTGTGLVASLMSGLSTWNIAWSRQARMYAQFQFFYLSILLVALMYVKPGSITNRRLASVTLVLLVCAGLSSYHSVLLYTSLLSALLVIGWGPRIVKRLGRETPLRLVGVLSVLGIGAVFVFWSGLADFFALGIVRLVGLTTGQFFTQIPDNSSLAYHDVFDSFLLQLHPYAILLAIPGVVLMAKHDWRSGVMLALLLGFPYLVYSTVFASYTTTLIYLRYILPELPILFVLTAITVSWIARFIQQFAVRTWKAAAEPKLANLLRIGIAMGLTVLILLAPQSGFQPSLANLSALPEPQPGYKMAANYVKPLMKPGDVIGAIWPENTYYYFGHTEYWIISNPISITLSGQHDGPNIVFYYTGSALIKDPSDMSQAMVLHPRGWLLLSVNDFSGISPELWSFIKTNMSLEAAASDPTIQTYLWNVTQ